MDNHESRMAVLVSRYATPLAVVLIVAGIYLAQPSGPWKTLTTFLLIFGLVFNAAMVYLIKNEGAGRGLIVVRVFVNVFANTALVYVLGRWWPPIWLLLALTPIATAIYASRKRTLQAAATVSGVLVMIHLLRDPYTAASVGVEGVRCLFMFLISLLINDVVRMVPQQGRKSV